jgi:hypothetical protein
MNYEKYAELKTDIEIYFANIIKKRFQEYVAKNSELHFEPEIFSHRLINDMLRKDGFEVFGMNANMDGFQLLLDFSYEYKSIDNFPFTRLVIEFENDGNYSVYLGEKSFKDEWTIDLEDEYKRFLLMDEQVFREALNAFKNTHLILILKS